LRLSVARPRVQRAGCGAFFLALALLVSGCGSLTPGTAPAKAGAPAPPQPGYNLAGYSAAFKQGYADACATPRRRDAERFKTDGDYSMGWNDGQSVCRGR
jgi:hypothetical protein